MHWWPKLSKIVSAAKTWARQTKTIDPRVVAIGYFGSYARLDYGYGSDLDLILIVDGHPHDFDTPYHWDTRDIPVPCDVLTYNLDQWQKLARNGTSFHQTIMEEAVWLEGSPPAIRSKWVTT